MTSTKTTIAATNARIPLTLNQKLASTIVVLWVGLLFIAAMGIWLGALSTFALASVGAACAPTFTALLAFRALQGPSAGGVW